MASVTWRKDRKAWFAFFYDATGNHLSRRLDGIERSQRRLAQRKADAVEAEYGQVAEDQVDLESAVGHYFNLKGPEISGATLTRYKCALVQFVKHVSPDGKRIALRALTFTQIEAWRNSRLGTRHQNTVRNDLKDLRAFLNWAVDRGWIDHNPADKVRLPQKRYDQLLIPDYATVNRIIEASRTEAREIYALALLGGRGGMRLGDILNLKWDNVQLEDKVVYVFAGKSRMPRSVPLDDEMLRFFREHPREPGNPAVFPSPYNIPSKQRSNDVGRRFSRWVAKFGPYTHKTLRHAFSDTLRRLGLSEAARSLVLGHEDAAITRIYTHPHLNEVRPVVERLAALGAHPEPLSPSQPTPVPSAGSAVPEEKSA